jgi:hypothetical protein
MHPLPNIDEIFKNIKPTIQGISSTKGGSQKLVGKKRIFYKNEDLFKLRTLVPSLLDEADQHISFIDALIANKFEYGTDILQFPHFENGAQTYTYSTAEISSLLLILIEKAKLIRQKSIAPSWIIKMRDIEQRAPDKQAKAMKKLAKKLTREDKYVTQIIRFYGFINFEGETQEEVLSSEEKKNRITLKNALFKGDIETLQHIYQQPLKLYEPLELAFRK